MRGKFKNVGTHIILIIASFISVFPLYWMIAAATNNSTDVLGGKLSLGTNFIQNLMKLTEMQNVSRAFCNSLFYSTILSVLSLFICSIAGYGFEIYHDKAKDTLMNILLLAMMVPFAATLIPLFKLFSGMAIVGICSEHDDLQKLILRGNCGEALSIPDENKLAETLLRLYKDEGLLEKYKSNARREVEIRYSKAVIVEKYRELFRKY